MFSQEVTRKDGSKVTVQSGDKSDFNEAVKAAKNDEAGKGFDINVPVMKGHDLLSYDKDLKVEPIDGTGAHNSPREAILDDGSVGGSDPMLVVTNEGLQTVTTAPVEEVTGSQKTKEVDASEVETTSDKVGSRASL